jgi:chorismate mutase
MPDNAETLARLRAEIDRADQEMHELLMRRSQVIEQLIAAKGTRADDAAQSRAAFRPDREAAVMMRLAERHQGVLPFLTVAHIWRVIIATFTQAQSPYQVHLGSTSPDLRDLARFQFGFSTPLVAHENAGSAMSQLEAEPGDLAMVRLDEPGAWWRGSKGSHIMAVLPDIAVPDDLHFPAAAVFCARSVPVEMLERAVLEVVAADADTVATFVTHHGGEMFSVPAELNGRVAALCVVPRVGLTEAIAPVDGVRVSQMGGAGPIIAAGMR